MAAVHDTTIFLESAGSRVSRRACRNRGGGRYRGLCRGGRGTFLATHRPYPLEKCKAVSAAAAQHAASNARKVRLQAQMDGKDWKPEHACDDPRDLEREVEDRPCSRGRRHALLNGKDQRVELYDCHCENRYERQPGRREENITRQGLGGLRFDLYLCTRTP